MKRLVVLLGILSSISPRMTIAGDTADTVAVDNQVLRLEIGKTSVPCLDRLVHQASGRELVVGSRRQSLFAIVVSSTDGGQKAIDSAQAGESYVNVETAGRLTRIRMGYTKFPTS